MTTAVFDISARLLMNIGQFVRDPAEGFKVKALNRTTVTTIMELQFRFRTDAGDCAPG